MSPMMSATMVGALAMRGAVFSVLCTAVGTAALAPRAFDPLPCGAVRPSGWMRAQLEAQLHGIGGRWLSGDARVNDSAWIGGAGAHLWNGAQAYPYWLNGAVPLAAALNDDGLTQQVHAQMQHVYATAKQQDGWLGPPATLSGWESGHCGLRGAPDVGAAERSAVLAGAA